MDLEALKGLDVTSLVMMLRAMKDSGESKENIKAVVDEIKKRNEGR